ncbi:hypothetical protein AMELA_G00168800 [Ameiurus melas]|uniref:Uncharacterized protein n=1 Tax=Ameiurus melas TaxID=219545 RepID=A0A7J6ABI1_AMEME|nr:hypothetical protein AMELA_G00168800 [Ameiurus melas]
MKGFFDFANTVWTIGASVYDYTQKNEAEKHINSLNDHIHDLKGKITTQEINIHSLQNILLKQLDHIQAMEKHSQALLHRMYAKDNTIYTQRCIIDMLFAVLIAMLIVMCTLLYMKRKN